MQKEDNITVAIRNVLMACTVEKGSEEVHNQERRAGLGGPDGGGGRDPEYASRAGCKQVTSLWTVQSQGPGEGWLSPEASRRVCATEEWSHFISLLVFS